VVPLWRPAAADLAGYGRRQPDTAVFSWRLRFGRQREASSDMHACHYFKLERLAGDLCMMQRWLPAVAAGCLLQGTHWGSACVTLKLRGSCDKAAHSSVDRQPCLLHSPRSHPAPCLLQPPCLPTACPTSGRASLQHCATQASSWRWAALASRDRLQDFRTSTHRSRQMSPACV
jgi:hypothetical protein